jgi:hypothetical protein
MANNRRSSNGKNGKVSTADVVRRAYRQIAELTGGPVEGVLGVKRTDDGWVVMFEVVELRRIPDSTDVLASYAVTVDKDGELQEYKRTKRYYRSQVEEE